jgi:hypothetical protein
MLSATSCNGCSGISAFSLSLPESWIRILAEPLLVLGSNGTNPKSVSSCGVTPISKIGVVSSIIRELRFGWIFRSKGDNSDHAPGMGCRVGVAGDAWLCECWLADDGVDLFFSRAISVNIQDGEAGNCIEVSGSHNDLRKLR